MSEIEFEELKQELKTLLPGFKKFTPKMIKKKRNYEVCFVRKRSHSISDFSVQGKKNSI